MLLDVCFFQQLEKERQQKREINIMKFIKNKWYIHTFLIEFE